MEKLMVNNYGMEELTSDAMKETDGGILIALMLTAALILVSNNAY